MIDEINELLNTICRKLSTGDVANYVVDMEIFRGNRCGGSDEIDSIENILENISGPYAVEIGRIKRTDLAELLEVTKECFEFVGDEGAHPNKEYLFSEEFEFDTSQALEQIKLLFSDNSEIFKFWLKQGHPFYPVFWDYAFLVRKSQDDSVFIGSSSD